MAPADSVLERDLRSAVRDMFKSDEEMTVNAVRRRVEEMHDLEQGFFISSDWKDRSKNLIRDLAAKLAEGKDNSPEPPTPFKEKKSNNNLKRSSPDNTPAPAPKRQKKAPAAKPTKRAKKPRKMDSESELSDLSESDEAPKKRNGAKKDSSEEPESELSDLDSSEDEKPKPRKKIAARLKAKPKPKAKARAKKQDTESELSEPEETVEEPDEEEEVRDTIESKPSISKPEEKLAADGAESDSSLSSVLDEPPPQKKRKSTDAKSLSKTAAKAPKELSVDEQEIKKLQSQLVKCGIRKIWGIELKQYGDNSKAKIRHLKGMLSDIGMSGRFSEARAREIKEQRELMADLEAVTDMNALWGSGAGRGRSSRNQSKRKSLKESSDEEDENKPEDASDGDEPENKAQSRVSKRMADLAFLGDESESE